MSDTPSEPRTVRGTWRLAARTWRAIGRRWFLPVLLVGGPVLWAQRDLLPEDSTALLRAAALCSVALLVAPLGWQLLFPPGSRPGRHPVRLLLYALLGVISVFGLAVTPSGVVGLEYLIGSLDPGLMFALGLFYVTGYGLARAVQMEDTIQAERERAEALALAAERAELMAVRSHLDPHFLFNTLNAIAEWCREDAEVAERALLQLSDMLRVVLAAINTETWPLSRELALVDSLAGLYAVRDPERFSLERAGWDAPECASFEVPPMLLMSLVENAFKHGPAAGHAGAVRVVVAPGAGSARITVENPGPFGGPRPGGEGLALVRRRVALAYADRGAFEIGTDPGGLGTLATLTVPAAPVGERA